MFRPTVIEVTKMSMLLGDMFFKMQNADVLPELMIKQKNSSSPHLSF